MTDDTLSDLLRSARVEVHADDVRAESRSPATVTTTTSPRKVRRPRRRMSLGPAALLVGVPTTTAAATYVGARTGWFGDPMANTEDVDSSEYLDVCSPDYLDILEQRQPTSALPSGRSWARATRVLQARPAANPDCQPGGFGLMEQETGIDASYAFLAECAWLTAGIAAIEQDDRAGWQRAGDELMTLATSDLNHAIDGGGIVEFDTAKAAKISAGEADKLTRQAARGCDEMWGLK
ncbi:hypothetical protein [Nocardioides sp. B-3]|uniref:hypothetical protein n=1 Tax=Nocardioides sp. B-3 TaxID=2895565 RepID=UPI002152B922|nr:hypothetical protein [Nocardioides sp. B-3]UUZ59893.1 hypothetical protein LP418_02265 [Nocardioides sp. B-3]